MSIEEKIQNCLHQYLLEKHETCTPLPHTPDIDDQWEQILSAYLPDGVQEFKDYPLVSLGWMMYIGMAVAAYWEEDWKLYSSMENMYTYLRSKEGYDLMDEYIRHFVLKLSEPDFSRTEALVQNCADITYSILMHENIEPGTREAYLAYEACLHQLYRMGAAVQLYRMGYSMQTMA